MGRNQKRKYGSGDYNRGRDYWHGTGYWADRNAINNMRKKFRLSALIFILMLFLPMSVFAHPGRTDAKGCHVCRKNCSSWGLANGEYHCHNKPTTAETKRARTESRQSASTQARTETSNSN